MTKKTTPGTNLVSVASIAEARQRKADNAVSPLEACPPQAHKFDGEDSWYITGSDGEHTYMWIARKKSKRSKCYTVAEVHPGMAKKITGLREAEEPIDLVLEDKKHEFKTIGDVLEALEEVLFEGLEFEDDGGDDDGGERVTGTN